MINPLTPNSPYSGRTAPLTSKRCILYIYSTNIGTEYFKHGIYSSFFPLQNAVCFIILTYLVIVLFTFYVQCVLKLKKKINSGAKRLMKGSKIPRVELNTVHLEHHYSLFVHNKRQYTWREDCCQCVRPAQLPVLTWISNPVPPGTTTTIRPTPGPRRIQHLFLRHMTWLVT